MTAKWCFQVNPKGSRSCLFRGRAKLVTKGKEGCPPAVGNENGRISTWPRHLSQVYFSIDCKAFWFLCQSTACSSCGLLVWHLGDEKFSKASPAEKRYQPGSSENNLHVTCIFFAFLSFPCIHSMHYSEEPSCLSPPLAMEARWGVEGPKDLTLVPQCFFWFSKNSPQIWRFFKILDFLWPQNGTKCSWVK